MRIPVLTNASLLVTDDFFREDVPAVSGEPVLDWVGSGPEVGWSDVKASLMGLMENHTGPRPASDAEAAVAVREHLALSRREAAITGMWQYATLVQMPEYVVWRWRSGGQVPRTRFLDGWRRNALGRLWWIAELTRDPG